jgi:ABC-type multidrug transport system fused ATPase/permease subunit
MPPFSHQQIEAFAQDRPNDKALRLWWRHIVKHPWLYILGLSSIIAVDLSDVSIPKVMKQLVDTLSQNNHVEKKLPWIILAFLLLQAIARIVWRITWAQQTHVVSAAMKSRLWERAT